MTTPSYLGTLSRALRGAGVDRPCVVIDLDAVDHNIQALKQLADPALNWRLVAKSLPCLPLLSYIGTQIGSPDVMTFSAQMLDVLLRDAERRDHLIGKPIPVTAAAAVLQAHPGAVEQVQWLVDTETRLEEYARLASETGQKLRVSLEIDVGLHRGGFAPEEVGRVVDQIATHGGLQLSGVMGYEAHLAKMPGFLRAAAARRTDQALETVARALPENGAGLCINSGGSMTFERYRRQRIVNDISFGSILVQPSDFSGATRQQFRPAAFIATPVLKAMPENLIPGLERVTFLRKRHMNIAIHGGHYLANPVHPTGFKYSGMFGRSSNQEVWTGPAGANIGPGDIALLLPTQSEAVLSQFGSLITVRTESVCDTWDCLPG